MKKKIFYIDLHLQFLYKTIHNVLTIKAKVKAFLLIEILFKDNEEYFELNRIELNIFNLELAILFWVLNKIKSSISKHLLF